MNITFCYCCTRSASKAVQLVQGWVPTCRQHASEAEAEEPGMPVCEIEDLEAMESEQSIVA